ncbi:MAG: SurA N-terminal domain-containing protein [Candidatus Omnitrophota bacterium]
MKKLAVFLALSVFLAGCYCRGKSQEIAVKVNDYEISATEFEQEFKDSNFGRTDTAQSRKDFLDNLVNRILILQDAQEQGLDKDPKFLKMVEKFWAQSLLRLAIEKKNKEFEESRLMDEWLDQLRKKADIKINRDLISGE